MLGAVAMRAPPAACFRLHPSSAAAAAAAMAIKLQRPAADRSRSPSAAAIKLQRPTAARSRSPSVAAIKLSQDDEQAAAAVGDFQPSKAAGPKAYCVWARSLSLRAHAYAAASRRAHLSVMSLRLEISSCSLAPNVLLLLPCSLVSSSLDRHPTATATAAAAVHIPPSAQIRNGSHPAPPAAPRRRGHPALAILQQIQGMVEPLLPHQIMALPSRATTGPGPSMSAALLSLKHEEDDGIFQRLPTMTGFLASAGNELMSEQELGKHVLNSRIALERITSMRMSLLLCSIKSGCPAFLKVFEDCIKPVDLRQVSHENSFKDYLGTPMRQTVANTCAIVSATKCVEVLHRWEYEALHGTGSFPCNAAAPRKLRRACLREKTWKAENGAHVGNILSMIQSLGGVRTTNGPTPNQSFLPVDSWQSHRWDNGDGLTADHIVNLLDARGPFVGVLWLCPWYFLFDSSEDMDLVYCSGCARNAIWQAMSINCFGEDNVGRHAVLCFGYRVCNGQLHLNILYNHKANGPERWIHFSEIEEVFTIRVKMVNLAIRRGEGGYPIRYPQSGYDTD